MEHNAFRDYCKAENSDDEEDNCDLQSRLYAEIYYGSNNVENPDAEEIIKVETPAVDNEQLRENANTDKAPDSVDGSAKSSFDGIRPATNVTNVSMDNSILPHNYDKSNVETVCASNEIEALPADDKTNLSIPRVGVSDERTQGSIEFATDNKESVVPRNVESTKSNSDLHIVRDTNMPAVVRPKTEKEIKQELISVQSLNVGIAATAIQSDVDPEKCDIDNNIEKIEEEACAKPKVDDSCDIFKKYEFSKLFTNNLYLEKYENLEKRLQEFEDEKEKRLRDKEQERTNIRENEESRRGENEQTEKDTRYGVLATSAKARKANNDEEVTVLSDTDSDSEESILEVPIPPKPQPPVINLQDSDEGSDSDDETSQDCFVVTQNKDRLTKEKKRKTRATEEDSRAASSIQESLVDPVTEDIMLNCTEVQKGASSIREIVELRKDARNTSEQCSDKDKDTYARNKSVNVSELYNKNVGKTDKSLLSVNDKDSNVERQLPLETVNKRNIVYERDKSKSVSFANKVTVTIFQNSNESSSSRKRYHEDDNEPCTSAKQRKASDDASKHGKRIAEQCEDRNKLERGSWEEYFFRPMSDTLKAFYNESRGQEDYDVKDIQSEMSKDPRLWAILDDDLMPNFSRQRFWNMTCNNCHQKGHPAHSCPEPRKLPRCHICGIEGHTESRCPQKMCLTCGKKQGTFRKTCESCRTLYCEMCKAVGHKPTECPDHWRRFHQTTRNSEISVPGNLSEVMKPADSLYCCNCTKRGHDSSTCHEYRWSQHFPTPAFVSNYTDEPECQDPSYIYMNSNDMIPLSKKAAKKMGKLRKVSFPSGNDIPQCCQVLYAYGSFQTKKTNGEEIFKNAPGPIVNHITTFLQGRNSTAMLDKISKLVKFEIKIFRNPHKVLMLRLRTVLNMSEYMLEIFLYWFQLSDEDKSLRIDTSLPRGLKNMLQFLTTKWGAFKEHVQENPKDIHKEIQFLKVSMANIHDANTQSSISRKIVELEGKLLRMYHLRPKRSILAARLEQAINKLNKSAKKEKNGFVPELNYGFYIYILVLYNKLFLPRTLTDNELQSLFDSYTQLKINESNKGKENKGSKKQNRHGDLFEKFVKNIHLYNLRSGKQEQRKEKCASTSNKTKQLPEDARAQGEQIPAATHSTTACSSSYIRQYNENAPDNALFAEDIPLDYYNTQAGSTNFNTVYPIEVVQLPRGQQDIPVSVENPVQKTDRKTLSHNLISIPLKVSARDATSSQHLQKAHLSSAPCAELRPEGIREKQPEIINISGGTVKSSTSQEDTNDTTSGAKKKKSKKEKKKQTSEDKAQPSENQVGNVHVSLESKAAKVINEAIAFNLPYVNKVVEEVKKRITDKNIKQEHVDMLQRLINLEKDHQQYVTSFCNYLH